MSQSLSDRKRRESPSKQEGKDLPLQKKHKSASFSPILKQEAETSFLNSWNLIQTRTQFLQRELELIEWMEQTTQKSLSVMLLKLEN